MQIVILNSKWACPHLKPLPRLFVCMCWDGVTWAYLCARVGGGSLGRVQKCNQLIYPCPPKELLWQLASPKGHFERACNLMVQLGPNDPGWRGNLLLGLIDYDGVAKKGCEYLWWSQCTWTCWTTCTIFGAAFEFWFDFCIFSKYMQIQINSQNVSENEYECCTKCLLKLVKLHDYTVKQWDCYLLLIICNYI